MIKCQFPFMMFLFASIALGQSKDCLTYEPDTVTVAGVIERDTFPGRPNYESIKNRDESENYWILKLSKSVCVTGNVTEVNQSENDITEMQLVLTEVQYNDYRKFIGNKVIAIGTLFHAHSAHHKTAVLLIVVKMVAS